MSQDRAGDETGVGTAYRDPRVSTRALQVVARSLQIALLPGEVALGIFASTRLRRSVSVLVVTDRRLLTLGDQHVGMPVVDEVDRDEVVEVHIERDKIFSAGVVTARTPDGEVNLGTLTYGTDTFLALEQVLAQAPPGRLPVIPTRGPGMPGTEPPGEPPQDDSSTGTGPGGTGPGGTGPGGQRPTHPLVVHLTALADLHERGALSDEEFAAAKARLLADPHAGA